MRRGGGSSSSVTAASAKTSASAMEATTAAMKATAPAAAPMETTNRAAPSKTARWRSAVEKVIKEPSGAWRRKGASAPPSVIGVGLKLAAIARGEQGPVHQRISGNKCLAPVYRRAVVGPGPK